jgi:peptidoglycan/LPS O-acetylase OafA/YrhL
VSTEAARRSGRIDWLDGVRGGAAVFVVLHHIWLTSWPSFPHVTGPRWLGWLLYGHMAVAVFIVVSGFSLALAPMRNGGTLPGGVRRFLRRRAWRILPAYWAALVVSVAITALFLDHDLGPGAIARALGVHGLLIQDAVGSADINGALWSIAIEWQIYFVFPLILLLARRWSLTTAVMINAVVVVVAHEIATGGGALDKINGLTPQFLALFALGALAVQLGGAERTARSRAPLAAAAIGPMALFVALAVANGSGWVVAHFFWMDLLFGFGVATTLAVIHAGGFAALRRVLASRVALWLGLFSYSIYLIHDPIVSVLDKYVFGPMDLSPLATFGATLALGLPVILALCYGFHLMFEAPFLKRRDLGAVRTMPIVRLLLPRAGRRAPAPVVAPAGAARD